MPSGETASYRKQKLFPFAEYLPGEERFPMMRRLLPGAATYVAGEQTVLFRLASPHRAIAAICYEILFSGHVGKFVRAGGNLVISPANDGWFGDSRWHLLIIL